jgi:DNA-binding Lrp family transcriptional regulator
MSGWRVLWKFIINRLFSKVLGDKKITMAGAEIVSIGQSVVVVGLGLTRPATTWVLSPCAPTNRDKGRSTVPNNCDKLDLVDRLILDALQDQFPLAPRPFAILAARINEANDLSLTEEEVLERVKSLRERRFVRRMGAIFNHNKLGYQSTLCAARAPDDKIESFARLVNSSRWVTHNYLRNDSLNIWFTFCYKSHQQLIDFFNHLKKESGISDIYEMPSQKIYKIRAVFKVSP